jgi:hypothetical protein
MTNIATAIATGSTTPAKRMIQSQAVVKGAHPLSVAYSVRLTARFVSAPQ